MPALELVTDLAPAGDQPEAIAALAEGIERGDRFQTLLGITGSGKSFTTAAVIEKVQRPTLILAPNKTLAAQLASEFRELFPKNRVEYFVSYYDYYQPADVPARCDHRGVGVGDLRARRSGGIRPPVPDPRRGGGARAARDPRPPRRAAVRAQRLRLRPEPVPGARRHHRGVPGLRGARRPDLALRRRGGAHRVGRPAHRRDRRGAPAAGALPRLALRDVRRA